MNDETRRRRAPCTDCFHGAGAPLPTAGDPEVIRCELAVGTATMRHKPTFIAETLEWLAQK